MANHSSARARGETPHVNQTTRTNTILNALKQRAQAVLNDTSIDPQGRAMIRYALETNDPWLAELVHQADASGTIDLSEIPLGSEADSIEAKIKALTEMISSNDKSTAALLVLMATLESATHPTALANIAKHVAFTRCLELNVYGMVDTQIAALEGELFSGVTLP